MAKMGRPKSVNPKSSTMNMRLLLEQRKRLEAYAEKYGLTKTQVIVMALERLYEEEEKQA